MAKATKNAANLLGENSSSNVSDDSSASGHSDVFNSPDRDEACTDYGLEFTNSNIGGPQHSQQGKPCKPIVAKRRTTGANKENVSTSAQAQRELPHDSPPVRQPRKQKTPMQRERIFLKEVAKLQSQKTFLIPRLPFSRLIREILMDSSKEACRITRTALEALQEASETYLTQQLQDSYTLTLHRGRVTLKPIDMELLRFIRGRT